MLTYKLVHLIEYHSTRLAAGLVTRVQMSERAGSYRQVSPAELQKTVGEIYSSLGTWLLSKSAAEVERRYTAIGARRREQGVPLSELVWVIALTKRNLCEFIDDVSLPGRAVEVEERHELATLLDQFFDEAVHAAVMGYEWASEHPEKEETGGNGDARKAS